MPRDSKVYLEDILNAAASVRSYVEGLSREEFLHDRKTIDAVIRNLEIIGKAVKQIPPEVRQKAPDVEWQKNVVANKLPAFVPRVRELLGEG